MGRIRAGQRVDFLLYPAAGEKTSIDPATETVQLEDSQSEKAEEFVKKILVVDDEAAILRILKIKLKASGYNVLTANDGREALEVIVNAKPDVVLLDIILPSLDGFQVLEQLKSLSPETPVIAFSARTSFEEQALGLGAKGFVPKPFDVNVLTAEVGRLAGDSTH